MEALTAWLAILLAVALWLGTYRYLGWILPARYTTGDQRTWGIAICSAGATLATVGVIALLVL